MAVIVFAGLGAGMVLMLYQTPGTVTGLTGPSSSEDLPPLGNGSDRATEEYKTAIEELDAVTEELNTATEALGVKTLASLLTVYLESQDVDLLLVALCEVDRERDRVRNDLMSMPFLNPSSPEYRSGVTFSEPTINRTEDGYAIAFSGTYNSSGEPIDLTFRAYADGPTACWSGLEG